MDAYTVRKREKPFWTMRMRIRENDLTKALDTEFSHENLTLPTDSLSPGVPREWDP